MNIFVSDCLFESDTLEVLSFDAPLKECAVILVGDTDYEIVNFRCVGNCFYQINLNEVRMINKAERFDFVISKHGGERNTFSLTREEFIKEFKNLARVLILTPIDANSCKPSLISDEWTKYEVKQPKRKISP